MTRLIGINGRLHSGKDTAYELITHILPEMYVQRAAFADRLKVSAAAALGYQMDTDEAVEFCNMLKESGRINVQWDEPEGFPRGAHFSGREFLQWYGTEAHRSVFYDDFWVTACLPDNWEVEYGEPDILVITDVRFHNEAARIFELGGEVWQIDTGTRLPAQTVDVHPSERPLTRGYITHVVSNTGDLNEFADNIMDALVW